MQTLAPPLPEHLDFDHLRTRALGHLQRLTGHRWTDHNAHDPGVTLLEALCYALTDLGYRAGHRVEDLLATSSDGVTASAGLFSPDEALGSAPVSAEDFERLLRTCSGVARAWFEAADSGDEAGLFYHPHDKAIGMEAAPGATALELRGLYQISIAARSGPEIDVALAASDRCFHANRGLCTDLIRPPEAAGSLSVAPNIALDLEPNTPDPSTVLQAALLALDSALAPLPRRLNFSEWRAAGGGSAEDFYEGPAPGSPAAAAVPRAVYASDLVQVLADVPGVRLVRSLDFDGNLWVLPLPPRTLPVLDVAATILKMKVFRQGLPVLPPGGLEAKIFAAKNAVAATTQPSEILPATSLGRDRRPGHYYSIRHHFPAVYSLQENADAIRAPVRVAHVRQMSAYLLFFEQLLAGEFAQLSLLPVLFDVRRTPATTYAQPSLRALPNADSVLKPNYEDEVLSDVPAGHHDRLVRLYDHLLARFGESLPPDATSEARRLFLQNWPAHSGDRGLGFDFAHPSALSGLEARVRGLLDPDVETQFFFLENILLRPLPGDTPDDDGIWLARAARPDPWSLRLTVVLRRGGRFGEFDEGDTYTSASDIWPAEHAYRQKTFSIIRQEVPAHLQTDFLWLSADHFAQLSASLAAWKTAHAEKSAAASPFTRLRVARDAVTDHLYALKIETSPFGQPVEQPNFLIGWTPPVLDITPSNEAFVEEGAEAHIKLDYSQPGVWYQLCDRYGNPAVNADYQPLPRMQGTGGELTLTTQALETDEVFRVKAIKFFPGTSPDTLPLPATREGFLRQKIRIRVGIKEDLNPRIENADILFEGQATVLIENAQAEVRYRLIVFGTAPGEQHHYLSGEYPAPHEGVSMRLTSNLLRQDARVRVLAYREFGAGQRVEKVIGMTTPDEDWVRVRANPGLTLRVAERVVNSGGATQITVEQTEPDVQYQLFFGPIFDNEFIQQVAARPGEQRFALPDNLPDARLLPFDAMEEIRRDWQQTEPATGNGGDQPFNIGPLPEDVIIYVSAFRQHTSGALGETVVLNSKTAVFTRPVTSASVAPEAIELEPGAQVSYRIQGAQPGVKYRLVRADTPDVAFSRFWFCHETRADNANVDGLYDADMPPGVRPSGSKVAVDFAVGPPQSPEAFSLTSDRVPASEEPLQLRVQAENVQTGLRAFLGTALIVKTLAPSSERSPAPKRRPKNPPPQALAPPELPPEPEANLSRKKSKGKKP